MTVKQYQKDSQTLWRVYCKVRSKNKKGLSVQKAESGILTEKEALKIERRFLEEAAIELGRREMEKATWGNIVKEFGDYLEGPAGDNLAKTTRRDYVATVWKHTQPWWRLKASEITVTHLRELFNKMSNEGFSVNHQKKMKNILGQMFSYGIEHGLIQGVLQSPTIGLKLARESEAPPEILTLPEIRKLLESAKALRSKWYYHWALALLTGMRSGELYALLWSDIASRSQNEE